LGLLEAGCPGFTPCFDDFAVDFSLLERREGPGRRECVEDGLSRGDFGGGIAGSGAPSCTISGMQVLQFAKRLGRDRCCWPLEPHSWCCCYCEFGGSCKAFCGMTYSRPFPTIYLWETPTWERARSRLSTTNRIHSQGTTVEGTPKRQSRSRKGTVVAGLGREKMGCEKRECRWVPPASGVDANAVQEPRFRRRKALPGKRLGRRRQHLILRIKMTRNYTFWLCFFSTSTRLLERFGFRFKPVDESLREALHALGCCSSAFRGGQLLPIYVDNTPLSSHGMQLGQVYSIRQILGFAVYSWRSSTVFLTW
jgi:hypothetical protein